MHTLTSGMVQTEGLTRRLKADGIDTPSMSNFRSKRSFSDQLCLLRPTFSHDVSAAKASNSGHPLKKKGPELSVSKMQQQNFVVLSHASPGNRTSKPSPHIPEALMHPRRVQMHFRMFLHFCDWATLKLFHLVRMYGWSYIVQYPSGPLCRFVRTSSSKIKN